VPRDVAQITKSAPRLVPMESADENSGCLDNDELKDDLKDDLNPDDGYRSFEYDEDIRIRANSTEKKEICSKTTKTSKKPSGSNTLSKHRSAATSSEVNASGVA
jgi:hypothetical protein